MHLSGGMTMDIHQLRLKALRWEISKFPSIAAFARHYQLDVTYVSQLLNGHRNIGERAARTLEGKFGWPRLTMDLADHDWEIDPDSPLLNAKPKVVEKTQRSAAQRFPIVRHVPSNSIREVPVISSVQAGMWREAVDAYAPGAGQDYIVVQVDLGEHAFALKVRGDSMEPEFKEGDTIIIDPDVKPHPGDFVVARNEDHDATFKKYRPRGLNDRGETVIELVPLNEDYPVLRSDQSPIEIIGTLVEHRRQRKMRE
jgi:SOS-response transcriptional repressor LexA